MQITKLERELSEYVSEWIDARWQKCFLNHISIRRDRRTGIYRLKEGDELFNYLDSVMGNLEDHLDIDKRTAPDSFKVFFCQLIYHVSALFQFVFGHIL